MNRPAHLAAAVGLALVAAAVFTYGVLSALDDGTVPLPRTGCTLTGRVTYNGEPVPLVLVIVTANGPGGGSASAMANDNGEFVVEDVPPGAVKIGLNTAPAKGAMISRSMAGVDPTKAGGKRAAPPKLVDLPAKYQNPDTSGLGLTVEKGTNKHDIPIAKG